MVPSATIAFHTQNTNTPMGSATRYGFLRWPCFFLFILHSLIHIQQSKSERSRLTLKSIACRPGQLYESGVSIIIDIRMLIGHLYGWPHLTMPCNPIYWVNEEKCQNTRGNEMFWKGKWWENKDERRKRDTETRTEREREERERERTREKEGKEGNETTRR